MRRSIDENSLRDLSTVPLMACDRKLSVRSVAIQLSFLAEIYLCVKISLKVLSSFVFVFFSSNPHSTMNFLLLFREINSLLSSEGRGSVRLDGEGQSAPRS